MDLTAVREALAANIENALGSAVNVSGYLRSGMLPPSVQIFPAPIEYDAAFSRGSDDWTFTVQMQVGDSTDIGQQQLLDKYLSTTGPLSMKAAIEQEDDEGKVTLGGLVDDLRVTRCDGYRRYQTEGEGIKLGCEWSVEVYGRGDT